MLENIAFVGIILCAFVAALTATGVAYVLVRAITGYDVLEQFCKMMGVEP